MNLKQAYQAWQEVRDNRQLYLKTKSAFQHAWVLLDFRKTCKEVCDEEFLAITLAQSRAIKSEKVSAASVLTQVLDYAHFLEEKWNPKPTFKFNVLTKYCDLPKNELDEIIYNWQEKQEELIKLKIKDNVIQEEISEEDLKKFEDKQKEKERLEKEKILEEIAKKEEEEERQKEDAWLESIKNKDKEYCNKIENKEQMEQQESVKGTAPKRIVQIDCKTLEVVKEFESVSKAEKETKSSNISRCLTNPLATSKGYYWCLAEKAETFKEDLKKAKKVKRKKSKIKKEITKKSKKEENRENINIEEHFDQLQAKIEDKVETLTPIAEEINLNKKLLSEFTDEELIEELKRRDTIKGNVKIVKVIEIEL